MELPLPAVNAFILHNATSTGGGLLVLTNQDLLTGSNLGNPPTVVTPFTLIDMGQLGQLLQTHPTSASGASAEVAVVYTVPLTAALGDSDHIGLKARSVVNSRSRDSADLYAYADLNPIPLTVSTANVAFGVQGTGTSSAPSVVQIVNTGSATAAFRSIATSPEFTATGDCTPSLAPGASCTVKVVFSPAAAGARTGTLAVASDAASPMTITLAGTAVVPQARPAVALTTTPIATSTGQTVTFKAAIPAEGAGPIPTGAVTFYNAEAVLGTATLSPTGDAVFATATLGAGTYQVYAQYAGDPAYFAATTDPTSLTIVAATPASIALSSSAAAVQAGAPVTFTASVSGSATVATGTITFLDGATPLGTGMLNAAGQASYTTSVLGNGTHTITATYPGDAVYAASTSATLVETVGACPTTTALTTSATTVALGSTVTFNAVVASQGGTPSGNVVFLDGKATLGTVALNAAGAASSSTTALTAGTHSITAQFAGTSGFTASASSAQQVVVAAPDFSVGTTPALLAIARGGTGTLNLIVTPGPGYSGTIKLACGALPTSASCTFSSSQLAFPAHSQGAQSVRLQIDTTARQSASLTERPRAEGGVARASLLGLLWAGLGVARKRGLTLRRMGLTLVLLVAALLGSLTLGCGTYQLRTTPAGAYTLQVTATDGANSHATTVPITVQ